MVKTATKKKSKLEVRYGTERGAEGVKCKCGGYAERVPTTHAEAMEYDCGRYEMFGGQSGHSCCAVAFECAVCGCRIVGTQQAPEMD